MAKKENNGNGLDAEFSAFRESKNIDRPTLISVLEEAFRTQFAKVYGDPENILVNTNLERGVLEIFHKRIVVEDVTDPLNEISLEDARNIDSSFVLGEPYYEEINLKALGRRSLLNIRQNLSSRITEIENTNIYGKYAKKIGELITAEVYQSGKKEIVVLDEEGNELYLPHKEQINGDRYKKGDTIKAIILKADLINGKPIITLSRTAEGFLLKLFEQEVPEIADGLITIKKIVRMPGERAKVAVETYDERIDPVGACVGVKGSRIHGIVRELRNENIDIINWSSNIKLLVQRALSPAKISSMNVNDELKRIGVYLKPEEVSLAIGKGGSNIKLAGMLIGYDIDVYRDIDEDEEDVMLDEFNNEIDQWIIDALKKMGCDTAKSVLSIPSQEIMKRADLEEETVNEVIRILKSEFED